MADTTDPQRTDAADWHTFPDWQAAHMIRRGVGGQWTVCGRQIMSAPEPADPRVKRCGQCARRGEVSRG